MAWIESHHTLRNHPKIFMLCKELKIERAQAIGHLHMLWWWALEHRETGDLVGLFPRDVAHACDWDGDGQKLLKALQRCGWIGSDMRIHDWLHYAGRLLKDRERKRQGRVHGISTDKGEEGLRLPYRTVPDRTVKDQKTGFFSDKEKKTILKDIAKTRHISPESEAAVVRFDEIVGELAKLKDVKNPLAMARHKAINQ
jgi:hypothetical protein